jgi:hypothetical protein
MPEKYASGKWAISECDRCGQQYKLKELKKQVLKTKLYNIKVCPSCWDPDQPQLQLGMYPVSDPQAIREPRPDTTYYSSGLTGLQTQAGSSNAITESGYPADGSRQIQWGWAPVGGASSFDTVLTPNYLIALGQVGTVTTTVN